MKRLTLILFSLLLLTGVNGQRLMTSIIGDQKNYTLGDDSYSFTLTSSGDGSGVSTLALMVSADQTLTLDGAARFYSDAAGTLDESTTWLVTTGDVRTRYIRCSAGTANLTFPRKTKVTNWNNWAGDGTGNAPSIGGDISKLSSLDYLYVGVPNTMSGSIANLTLLTYVYVGGSNTVSGSVANLISLTYLYVEGNNDLSGDVTNLISLTVLQVKGNNTLSGSIAALTSLTTLWVTGSNTLTGSVTNLTSLGFLYVTGTGTLSGDVSYIVSGLEFLYLPTCHMDTYTAGATWGNAYVVIDPDVGYGYSSTEIDNMLIDMDNSGVFSGQTIELKGSSAPRTSASDAAVTHLESTAGGSNTVITN